MRTARRLLAGLGSGSPERTGWRARIGAPPQRVFGLGGLGGGGGRWRRRQVRWSPRRRLGLFEALAEEPAAQVSEAASVSGMVRTPSETGAAPGVGRHPRLFSADPPEVLEVADSAMASPAAPAGQVLDSLGNAAHVFMPGEPRGQVAPQFGGLPALWRFRCGLAPLGLALGRGGKLVSQIGDCRSVRRLLFLLLEEARSSQSGGWCGLGWRRRGTYYSFFSLSLSL